MLVCSLTQASDEIHNLSNRDRWCLYNIKHNNVRTDSLKFGQLPLYSHFLISVAKLRSNMFPQALRAGQLSPPLPRALELDDGALLYYT
jgi:hypothetical protein